MQNKTTTLRTKLTKKPMNNKCSKRNLLKADLETIYKSMGMSRLLLRDKIKTDLGISDSTFSCWIRGLRYPVRKFEREYLANAFGLPVLELYPDHENHKTER